ncbi:MAG: arylsulfatase, partial [Planctomycetales bacterium]
NRPMARKGRGMNLKSFVLFLSAVAAGNASAETEKPNIVFLMADDMGYGDVGCYNPQSKIPTPNMDRLAKEGMRFTDAHTPSSVCTPTRYGVLTGRYCWRSRLKRGVQWGFDHPLIESDRVTVASFLKRNGYATACVGKWHLGLGWTTKDGDEGPWADRSKDKPHQAGWGIDYAKPLRGGPNALGFDYFFGISASNNMPPYCFIENARVVGNPNVVKSPLHYGNSKAPMVAGWDDSRYGPTMTDKAIRFIERHHGDHPNQPFFLYFPSQAPHRPCVPPDFVQGKSQAGRRGDMVFEFDWSVGRVLETLDRLGLAENTLIFVTSDNGATPGDPFPPESKKRNGNVFGETHGHKSCGDWRGYKSQIWEGGHRVPFLARWPKRVQAGSVNNELICLTDLLATVADVLDANLPKGAGADGGSLLPVLLGKATKPVHEAVVHHDFSGRFAIRQGDWKYVAPATAVARRRDDPKQALYNLRDDPRETMDQSAKHRDVVRRLANLLALIQEAE